MAKKTKGEIHDERCLKLEAFLATFETTEDAALFLVEYAADILDDDNPDRKSTPGRSSFKTWRSFMNLAMRKLLHKDAEWVTP